MTRLMTVDDLAAGMSTVLAETLPDLIDAFGLNVAQGGEKPYTAPATWTQIPRLEVLQAADMPAGAIASSGTVGTPTTRRTGVDATWRLSVAVFDRGQDHNVTARRVRTWAALVRAVGLRNPTLGGVASGVRWVSESYRLASDRGAARTLGGCQVDFDVDARNVVDVEAWQPVTSPQAPDITVR